MDKYQAFYKALRRTFTVAYILGKHEGWTVDYVIQGMIRGDDFIREEVEEALLKIHPTVVCVLDAMFEEMN